MTGKLADAGCSRKGFINKEKLAWLEERMSTEGEEDISVEERTVGHTSNLDFFHAWTTETKILADLINNDIIVRAFPTFSRGATVLEVGSQVNGQIPMGKGMSAGIAIAVKSKVNGDIYIPDVAVAVKGYSSRPLASVHGVYAVAVVEIGSSYEGFEIHQRSSWFLSAHCPSVEFYVGIKKFPNKTDSSKYGMVATVYSRGAVEGEADLVQVISFGTEELDRECCYFEHRLLVGVGAGGPECNAQGIPLYVLNLPVPVLLQSLIRPPLQGLPPVITLDLYRVQQYFMLPDITF